jgi:hypothetical protein
MIPFLTDWCRARDKCVQNTWNPCIVTVSGYNNNVMVPELKGQPVLTGSTKFRGDKGENFPEALYRNPNHHKKHSLNSRLRIITKGGPTKRAHGL